MNVSTLQNSEENQTQMLQNISALQDMEKNLYKQLEAAPPSTSSTTGDTTNPSLEQEKIIQKINEISEMRIALFKNITNMYGNMQSNVANSRTDLVDQMTVVGVVEGELDNAKANLHKLTDAKNSKVRMAEINTYYGKRYSAHAGVMKILILICIPLLILAILKKKSLIPGRIANGVSGFVIVVGAIVLIRRMWDLSRRDNMNYDEYQWFFDPASQSPTVYQYDAAQLAKLGNTARAEAGTLQNDAQNVASSLGLGCVGAACCSPGMTFDKTSEKCVENVSKETFQNGQFNKTSFIAPNDSVCLQPTNSVVKPFSAVDYASV